MDWPGRVLREDKREAIDGALLPILQRLHIAPKHWLYVARSFESRFKGLVGTAHRLKTACETLGNRRTPDVGACCSLFA